MHVVFVSSIRYREPAVLALMALAAAEIMARMDAKIMKYAKKDNS